MQKYMYGESAHFNSLPRIQNHLFVFPRSLHQIANIQSAARRGDVEALRSLFDQGLDINTRYTNGVSEKNTYHFSVANLSWC